MHLARLDISGFRKLREASWSCAPGLNVVVGENNAGKTAFIDALRCVLGNYYATQEDFHVTDEADALDEIAITAEFTNLSVDDEAQLLTALVPSGRAGSFNARVQHTVAEVIDVMQRQTTVGLSGAPSNEFHNNINVVYLQPLRDPDTGLRPGRASQIGDLLHRITNDEQRSALEEIAKESNQAMVAHESVVSATQLLNANLIALTGSVYAQHTELSFAPPTFLRLAQGLEAMAEGLPITHNGLGSSNLLYVAAVLGNMIEDAQSRYKALIIEEPEAHLHPHYQILLLRFLQATALEASAVQIFVTTHSPILASQAAASRITIIRRDEHRFIAAPFSVQDADAQLRVRQYLDATRSELFFAKRLVMVEGDGELLLLPTLAKVLGIDVAEQGVSIVSAAGLNFNIFIPFISGDVLGVPAAILTDGDPPEDVYPDINGPVERSDYAESLIAAAINDELLLIAVARKTFEYDLCLHDENREAILASMGRVHPRLIEEFREIHGHTEGRQFAASFYRFFFQDRSASKPRFASELALYISGNEDCHFVVPPYIARALGHVVRRQRHADA